MLVPGRSRPLAAVVPVVAGEAFSREQKLRLDRAVGAASGQTGIRFAVRVGRLEGGSAPAHVERLLAALADPAEPAVLVYVCPGERVLEIGTTAAARERLSDQACALATLSMTTSFGLGDLVGGVVNGLRMMADAAGRATLPSGRPLSPPQ